MFLQIGLQGTAQKTVTEQDTAKVVKSGTLPVLATPVLSAVMEEAAVKAVEKALPEGTTTVGGLMNLRHMAPTLPGETITAEAVLIGMKKTKLTYRVTARDSHGLIGEADHIRFIVDNHDFMEDAKERASQKLSNE